MANSLVTVVAADASRAAAIAQLFERSGCSCYCRWWHFPGDKNAWLDVRAHRPEENRAALLEALEQGDERARALIALSEDERVVGWLKLSPARSVSKLYAQRPYKGMPELAAGSRDGVFTIGCCLVDPEFRERGVAKQLIARAPEFARRWGARAIEAFPFRAPHPSADLLWTGPENALRAAGFEPIAAVGPYPVFRLDLGG